MPNEELIHILTVAMFIENDGKHSTAKVFIYCKLTEEKPVKRRSQFSELVS